MTFQRETLTTATDMDEGTLWIWDASPIVHAVKAERADELCDLARRQASEHVLTATVLDDLRRWNVSDFCLARGWPVLVEEPADLEFLTQLAAIQMRLGTKGTTHLGESTVIAMATRLNAVAVIDDLDARRVANRQGVATIGVLGVIDEGERLGHHTMASATALVADLARSGGRYPRPAVDDFPWWSRQRRKALGLDP